MLSVWYNRLEEKYKMHWVVQSILYRLCTRHIVCASTLIGFLSLLYHHRTAVQNFDHCWSSTKCHKPPKIGTRPQHHQYTTMCPKNRSVKMYPSPAQDVLWFVSPGNREHLKIAYSIALHFWHCGVGYVTKCNLSSSLSLLCPYFVQFFKSDLVFFTFLIPCFVSSSASCRIWPAP